MSGQAERQPAFPRGDRRTVFFEVRRAALFAFVDNARDLYVERIDDLRTRKGTGFLGRRAAFPSAWDCRCRRPGRFWIASRKDNGFDDIGHLATGLAQRRPVIKQALCDTTLSRFGTRAQEGNVSLTGLDVLLHQSFGLAPRNRQGGFALRASLVSMRHQTERQAALPGRDGRAVGLEVTTAAIGQVLDNLLYPRPQRLHIRTSRRRGHPGSAHGRQKQRCADRPSGHANAGGNFCAHLIRLTCPLLLISARAARRSLPPIP